jgi:hypothetical protein
MSFCHICLKDSTKGEVDRLELCKDCFNKIRPCWDKKDVKQY